MNILLTGAAGQLGQELLPCLRELGTVVAVDRVPAPGVDHPLVLDLSDAGRLETLLNRQRPGLIVNAAAYTAVDQAEQTPGQAFAVNAEMPGRIARWAARADAAVVHYSTDYVFDGTLDRAYTEDDAPSPLSVYGDSKWAGERAVSSSGCHHLVLRSSWIYAAHGNNFVLKMLELAHNRPQLSVVGDQVGCPTWARNLAGYTLQAIRKQLLRRRPRSGLYHCADADPVSWFEFASRVFRVAAGLGLIDRMPALENIRSKDFPQLATRPAYSVLDSRLAADQLGIRPAPLDASLHACMKELKNE